MATTKKLPKWQRKLRADLRKHLRETCEGAPTLEAFKRNRLFQLRNGVVCRECRSIALALGLEEAEAC